MSTSPNQPTSDTGPETWVREAIAQQEEYIKRRRPCAETGGDHSWDWFSSRPGVRVEMCWRCRVTRTDEDYQRKITAASGAADSAADADRLDE